MPEEIIYTNEDDFDIKRVNKQNSFEYYWVENNKIIDDELVIDQIETLVIPPAWKEVKICSKNCMHIRAIGIDQKERKQYIYNPEWIAQRNREKFSKLVDFAKVLPKIRKKAHQDIEKKKWRKDKAIALVVLLLDETYLRIGNSQYKNRNKTYGLTTLRRKHLEIEAGEIFFEYKAKSNQYRKVSVETDHLINLIRESSELPGYELFRYREAGSFHNVTSSDVNEYLRAISNDNYSAKDFRTWGGTTMAVEFYSIAKDKVEKNSRLKFESTLVKLVAEQLGNTPASCKEYYIHPKVLNYLKNKNEDKLAYEDHQNEIYSLSGAEKKTLEILES